MNMQAIGSGTPPAGRVAEADDIEVAVARAAREAVARAWASGSFLIVRDTARRIAGAGRDPSREELADAVSRLLIEECARVGVSMVFDAQGAAERLKREGTGSVIAL